MHQPGAILDTHILGQHDRAASIDERVPILGAFEIPATAAADLGELDSPSRHHRSRQLGCEDRLDRFARRGVDVTDAGIFEVRVHCHRDVRRQGPGVVVQIIKLQGRPSPHADGTPRTIMKLTKMLGVDASWYSSSASASAVRSVIHQWMGLSWRHDIAPLDQVSENIEDPGFITRVERQVGVRPITRARPAA